MRERNINTTNHQGKLERELSCVERDREIEEKMNGGESYGAIETQYIRRHHKHEPRENQCTSALVKHIRAPVHLVSLFFHLKLFWPISWFFVLFFFWIGCVWWVGLICVVWWEEVFYFFVLWRSVRLCLFCGVFFEFPILYSYLGVWLLAFLLFFFVSFLGMGG